MTGEGGSARVGGYPAREGVGLGRYVTPLRSIAEWLRGDVKDADDLDWFDLNADILDLVADRLGVFNVDRDGEEGRFDYFLTRAAREARDTRYGDNLYHHYLEVRTLRDAISHYRKGEVEVAEAMIGRGLAESLQGNDGE